MSSEVLRELQPLLQTIQVSESNISNSLQLLTTFLLPLQLSLTRTNVLKDTVRGAPWSKKVFLEDTEASRRKVSQRSLIGQLDIGRTLGGLVEARVKVSIVLSVGIGDGINARSWGIWPLGPLAIRVSMGGDTFITGRLEGRGNMVKSDL
jgi:hypothetical protein